jgi:FemAB-related protein (PEP-CTERM system-associated)
MPLLIRVLKTNENHLWDKYVDAHPQGTIYHLTGWRDVVNKAFNHRTYYFVAVEKSESHDDGRCINIRGVLPLVQMKNFFFGNRLISMPYVDFGGILADSPDIENQLIKEAIELLESCSSKILELRHAELFIQCKNCESNNCFGFHKCFLTKQKYYKKNDLKLALNTLKFRMLLSLPNCSEELFNSFKSKLRSQIRKPTKEGLYCKIGELELLNDFYSVISINMRDLGSPVHSKNFFRLILSEFQEYVKIFLVFKDAQPLACSLVFGFKNILFNPWASALKKYNSLSPNMLLYWTMLRYGCDNGYEYFDFGRSTPNEGTYKFKRQWGAWPKRLHWYHFAIGEKIKDDSTQSLKLKFAVKYWKKLPIPVTRFLGPMVRRHIGL